ncbi:MAG: hypothetical protein HN909_02340 [Phycisphaerales bacterium]|nr:hypothetical protein [Phycisphaerales bacterium]
MYKALLTLSLLLVAGCPTPPHTVTDPRLPTDPAEREYELLWQASRRTLMDYGFTLDWQDRREGLMSTRALSSGHLLESAWRRDASNLYYLRENALHNMFRAVEVQIERTPAGSYTFAVRVALARSNAKPNMVTDTSTITEDLEDEVAETSTPSRSAYKDRSFALRNRYVYEDLIRPTLLTPEQKRRMAIGQDSPRVFTPLGFDLTMSDLIANEISAKCGVKPILSAELDEE